MLDNIPKERDNLKLYREHKAINMILTQCIFTPSTEYVNLLIEILNQRIFSFCSEFSYTEIYPICLEIIQSLRPNMRTLKDQIGSLFK